VQQLDKRGTRQPDQQRSNTKHQGDRRARPTEVQAAEQLKPKNLRHAPGSLRHPTTPQVPIHASNQLNIKAKVSEKKNYYYSEKQCQ
jgi:hypothetical protein